MSDAKKPTFSSSSPTDDAFIAALAELAPDAAAHSAAYDALSAASRSALKLLSALIEAINDNDPDAVALEAALTATRDAEAPADEEEDFDAHALAAELLAAPRDAAPRVVTALFKARLAMDRDTEGSEGDSA